MGKRKVLNESALKEIKLAEEGELYGRVIKLLGSDQVLVKCTDDITRRGRIRGKLKRRIWIRDNDVVVIAPWDFKETCLLYTSPSPRDLSTSRMPSSA